MFKVVVAMRDSVKAALAVGAVGAGAALAYLLTRKVQAAGLTANFAGFHLRAVDASGTTTRQSTGETAKDFQFYPLINLTPDLNGTFTVAWRYINRFNGAEVCDSGTITNTFSNLVGGQPVQLQLIDNRPPETSGRDPTRNGAIAIGDVDFIRFGKQDGNWHTFESLVTATITSPSGASATVNGQLMDNFKSVGALSASFAGFALTKIT